MEKWDLDLETHRGTVLGCPRTELRTECAYGALNNSKRVSRARERFKVRLRVIVQNPTKMGVALTPHTSTVYNQHWGGHMVWGECMEALVVVG